MRTFFAVSTVLRFGFWMFLVGVAVGLVLGVRV